MEQSCGGKGWLVGDQLISLRFLGGGRGLASTIRSQGQTPLLVIYSMSNIFLIEKKHYLHCLTDIKQTVKLKVQFLIFNSISC